MLSHQAETFRHLLLNSTSVRHYLLAWEMGTGKGVLAARLGAATPAPKLYLCPASTKQQVAREIRRFHPGALVQVVNGRKARLDLSADWIVINYDLVLSDQLLEQLLAQRWSLLVLDECHLLRTPKAQRTQRVLGRQPCLAGQADRVLALSGTPTVNSALDLFPLINRLFPRAIAVKDSNGELRRMQLPEFVQRYCNTRLVHIGGGRTVEQVYGGKNLAELRERLAQYVSRLKLDQVLDLPPLTVVDYALTVEPDSAVEAAMATLPPALIEALRQTDDEHLPQLLRQHASELATLRRLLGTLKAPAAAEHIRERLEGGEDRVLAFFHHRDVGDLLLKQLRAAGVAATMIRGDTPADARIRAIDALTDGNLQVLLLQNQSGSLGLNLQACRYAAVVEPDWTDATTQQAIGRIYRAGQTRHCTVEFLLAPDTLDERVVVVARRKAEVAATLIDSHPPQKEYTS